MMQGIKQNERNPNKEWKTCDSLVLLKIEELKWKKKMQHPAWHNSRMLCSEQMYFNNVDIYHGLQALNTFSLFHHYGLINMKVEKNGKPDGMLPWNHLELYFFLRHNSLPTPLLCTTGTFWRKPHTTRSFCSTRLQLELSKTSSPAQPCVGGLDAHSCTSN